MVGFSEKPVRRVGSGLQSIPNRFDNVGVLGPGGTELYLRDGSLWERSIFTESSDPSSSDDLQFLQYDKSEWFRGIQLATHRSSRFIIGPLFFDHSCRSKSCWKLLRKASGANGYQSRCAFPPQAVCKRRAINKKKKKNVNGVKCNTFMRHI